MFSQAFLEKNLKIHVLLAALAVAVTSLNDLKIQLSIAKSLISLYIEQIYYIYNTIIYICVGNSKSVLKIIG